MSKPKTGATADVKAPAICPTCNEPLLGRSTCASCTAPDGNAKAVALLSSAIANTRRNGIKYHTTRILEYVAATDDDVVCGNGVEFRPEDPGWPMAMALIILAGKDKSPVDVTDALGTRNTYSEPTLIEIYRRPSRGSWVWEVCVSTDTCRYPFTVAHDLVVAAFADQKPGMQLIACAPPKAGKERVAFVAGPWKDQHAGSVHGDWARFLPSHLWDGRSCAELRHHRSEKGDDLRCGWKIIHPYTREVVAGDAASFPLAAQEANDALIAMGIEHDGLLPMQTRIQER
ncbi:MAG: hypothetical protein ACHREM_00165 [Polyangiales bacterium]